MFSQEAHSSYLDYVLISGSFGDAEDEGTCLKVVTNSRLYAHLGRLMVRASEDR